MPQATLKLRGAETEEEKKMRQEREMRKMLSEIEMMKAENDYLQHKNGRKFIFSWNLCIFSEQYKNGNTKLTEVYEKRQNEVEKLEKHVKKEKEEGTFLGAGNSISGKNLIYVM